jgi:hypothetical protein
MAKTRFAVAKVSVSEKGIPSIKYFDVFDDKKKADEFAGRLGRDVLIAATDKPFVIIGYSPKGWSIRGCCLRDGKKSIFRRYDRIMNSMKDPSKFVDMDCFWFKEGDPESGSGFSASVWDSEETFVRAVFVEMFSMEKEDR